MATTTSLPSWIGVKKNPAGWKFSYSVVLSPKPRPLSGKFTTTNAVASQHNTKKAAEEQARKLVKKYKTLKGVWRDYLGWK